MSAVQKNAIARGQERKSVMRDMAEQYGMEPEAFEATIRATVVPKDCTKEQLAAFMLVAKEYGLNPLTKEIYAFPGRTGGIQPIVSVDGWINLANSHVMFDGLEFEDHFHEGHLVAVTAVIYRKDRNRPTKITEYMNECRGTSDVWKRWPARMLRHKAAIQCIRYAFGFAGIIEPDEYERQANEANHKNDAQPSASRSSSLAAKIGVVAHSPEVVDAETVVAVSEQQTAEPVEV